MENNKVMSYTEWRDIQPLEDIENGYGPDIVASISTPIQEQSDISLDAAELKKAIQLKNEGWADSLEFKIWSLAYENNSEDNYRSVIAEVEKLQPKIIEQSDVDKVEIRVIATLEASVSDLENRLYKASVDNAKIMAKLQQSHPPVTSMSAEDIATEFAEWIGNQGEWIYRSEIRSIAYVLKNIWENQIDYSAITTDQLYQLFLTQYKQK